MSKVVIAGDASGTGTFTISSPNSNTDRTLVLPDEAGTVLTSAGVPASAMPAGSVLQVVSTTLTTGFSTAVNSNFNPVTGLTASITPSSSTSKIMVLVTMTVGSDTNYVNAQLTKGGSSISGALATAEGSRSLGTSTAWPSATYGTYAMAFNYLDSPATTSATTYGVQIGNAGAATLCINRSQADDNSTLRTRGTSTITVMEIAE